jgi:hypothetical protein
MRNINIVETARNHTKSLSVISSVDANFCWHSLEREAGAVAARRMLLMLIFVKPKFIISSNGCCSSTPCLVENYHDRKCMLELYKPAQLIKGVWLIELHNRYK